MASVEKEPKTYVAFMAPGECSDEITFVFNDDQRLYVSQNLLTLASPVFKVMFDSQSNFKENTERIVKIVDIAFEDFREFLYCLHPDIQKPVTFDNVLDIVSIAEKYQSQLTSSRCKEIIEKFLDHLLSTNVNRDSDRYELAYKGLRILHKVLELNYTQDIGKSKRTLAQFGSKFFTGYKTLSKRGYHSESVESSNQARDMCKKAFVKLDAKTKLDLVIVRLGLCDDMEMIMPTD